MVTYVVITLYITGILPFIVVYTMFTFSIVVIDIGVLYFVQVIGGGLCPLHKLLGGGVSPLCPLPTSTYVTYVRLFVVVPKCKTFTCGYMPCVWNKCVHIEAQKYTTMFVSSWPCSIHLQHFIYLFLFTRYIVQQCNGYVSALSTHQSYFRQLFFIGLLYATNYTLPECLLLFHFCLHTLNLTLFVRAEEFTSL